MLKLHLALFTQLRLNGLCIATAAMLVALSSCRQEVIILYGQTFEQVRDSAHKRGADFCIVLSNPDCPPCKTFIERIWDRGEKGMLRNTLFNIVDVSQPENRWYAQWICPSGIPVTCVFTSAGELKAVVSGSSAPSLQCIQSALRGDVLCANSLYNKYWTVANGDHLSLLNTLLTCKSDLDKGVDVGETLNACLRQTNYPWPVYLKCLNEEKQGRRDEALYWANQLLAFDDALYFYLYNDLYTEAKFIIDPNHIPEEDAALSVTDKLYLDNCQVGQPKPFTLEVSNTGKVQLHIREIRVSCTCLKALGSQQLLLNPGETKTVAFEFTAEEAGKTYREITLVSNGAEAVKQVKIEAYAE